MSYRKCPGHKINPGKGFKPVFSFDSSGQCTKCGGFYAEMNKIPKGFVFSRLLDKRKEGFGWIIEYVPDESCPHCQSYPLKTRIKVKTMEEFCLSCGKLAP